jgi:hypothetical protein
MRQKRTRAQSNVAMKVDREPPSYSAQMGLVMACQAI